MRMHFVMPSNKASYQVTLCIQETQLVQVVPAGTARLVRLSHNDQATVPKMACVQPHAEDPQPLCRLSYVTQ